MPRMFQISAAHLQAFSEQQRGRFEDEMVVHLRREYPDPSSKMGEARLRELIREGIETARGYHIILEADVARYIELMLTIAPDFDRSQQTPWAPEILANRSATGVDKLNRIQARWMAEGSSRAVSTPSGVSAGGNP